MLNIYLRFIHSLTFSNSEMLTIVFVYELCIVFVVNSYNVI